MHNVLYDVRLDLRQLRLQRFRDRALDNLPNLTLLRGRFFFLFRHALGEPCLPSNAKMQQIPPDLQL